MCDYVLTQIPQYLYYIFHTFRKGIAKKGGRGEIPPKLNKMFNEKNIILI